jgi:hypothetical protein
MPIAPAACQKSLSAGQHLIVEKIYDKMMMCKLFSTAGPGKYLQICR